MKELSTQEMATLEAGSCLGSAIGMGVSIIGGCIGLATLNPVGVVLGVIGIYAGGASVVVDCMG